MVPQWVALPVSGGAASSEKSELLAGVCLVWAVTAYVDNCSILSSPSSGQRSDSELDWDSSDSVLSSTSGSVGRFYNNNKNYWNTLSYFKWLIVNI